MNVDVSDAHRVTDELPFFRPHFSTIVNSLASRFVASAFSDGAEFDDTDSVPRLLLAVAGEAL